MLLDQYIQNPYLRALVIFLILFLVLRLVVFMLQLFAVKITAKTKVKIDEALVKKSNVPVTLLLILLSLGITIKQLELSEGTEEPIFKILYSLAIIIAGYLLYIILDLLTIRAWKRFAAKTKTKLDENLISLARNLLKIILIIAAGLYILGSWGVEVLPILGALGVAGIAIALALQPTLSNIFSGISMVLDKSVAAGDLVYLNPQTKGRVLKVGMRSTKIITFDNELIIVPNNKLADTIIQNVTQPGPKNRVVIQFSVAHGSDVEKAKKIVLNEVKGVQNICKDPDPLVRFVEIGDQILTFKAYFYVDRFEHKFNAIDEVNTRIYNALNKAGIVLKK